MSCRHRHNDAAYVLGALCPSERSSYETHLTGCAECAAAVATLVPIPGLLGRVEPAALRQSADPAAQTAAPPRERRVVQLLAQVDGERRRQAWARRWRLATAATLAAALAATVAIVGVGLLGEQQRPGPSPAAVAMARVAAVAPVTAEVAVEPTDGGTEVWMTCQYPAEYDAPPRIFRLFAVGADGDSEQLGSWYAGPGDQVTLTGLTRLTGELARIELRSEAGTILLAYELP